MEIALLEEIAELKKNRGIINKELSEKERKLEAVRKERLENKEPDLFK